MNEDELEAVLRYCERQWMARKELKDSIAEIARAHNDAMTRARQAEAKLTAMEVRAMAAEAKLLELDDAS